MTSLRARLELHGTLTPDTRELLLQNYGSVPLCCHAHFKDGKFQCDQVKEPLPYKEFRDHCLVCQAEMLNKIGGL